MQQYVCIKAITWTDIDLMLIGPSVTHFNEIASENQTLLFKKMHLKIRLQNVNHFVQASFEAVRRRVV